MIKIGIVGHRFFDDPASTAYVANECDNLLAFFKNFDSELVALSAIAQGADSIFAEAALDMLIPLKIIRPFDCYRNDFQNASCRKKYEALRNSASSETFQDYPDRSMAAYSSAMKWIVSNSDVLIAVWDKRLAQGSSVTAGAVDYAVTSGVNWIHIDVASKKTFFHLSASFSQINTQNYYATAQ